MGCADLKHRGRSGHRCQVSANVARLSLIIEADGLLPAKPRIIAFYQLAPGAFVGFSRQRWRCEDDRRSGLVQADAPVANHCVTVAAGWARDCAAA